MSTNNPDSEDAGRRFGGGFLGRALRSLAAFVLIIVLLLFLPAGDFGWRNGWLFVLVFAALVIGSVVYLRLANPEIFVARSSIHAGTKAWDKVMIFLLLASLVAIFPVAGLDHRYQWSSVPVWLVTLGYVLFSFGFILSAWVYGVNKFAEPGVRIQRDRGQRVIDTGPYTIVRHPLYLASIILYGGIPLALASFWALIPVAVGMIALFVRTAWEDQLLHEELEGYKEYASRVRHRLIPGVW